MLLKSHEFCQRIGRRRLEAQTCLGASPRIQKTAWPVAAFLACLMLRGSRGWVVAVAGAPRSWRFASKTTCMLTYGLFYRGRYRDRLQEQNWVLALRRLIFHDPGNRRLSCECPVRRKHGAVLGAIKTKPLRGGLWPVLTAPARSALLCAGRGEETAIQTEQRNWPDCDFCLHPPSRLMCCGRVLLIRHG